MGRRRTVALAALRSEDGGESVEGKKRLKKMISFRVSIKIRTRVLS